MRSISSYSDLYVSERVPLVCHIFCSVIDNFGDAGVCWRLARQLANEYSWKVHLFIDKLSTLAYLVPELDTRREQQVLAGVDIEHWHDLKFTKSIAAALNISDVVIEAFSCHLPPLYLAAMAQRPSQVVWISLEYLSSEDWVVDFHLRTAPHPYYTLTKTFFFPGFDKHTGGVLCEQDLDVQRRNFITSVAERECWWTTLGIPQPDPTTIIVSLFCYKNLGLDSLLEQWRDGVDPLMLLVPEGQISKSIARFFTHLMGSRKFVAGMHANTCALSIYILPFTSQLSYDKLLWSTDVNFVRGEDSFVRAQWARKPFVWHVYPQENYAHLPKLDAVLARIGLTLESYPRDALIRFWQAWNGNTTYGPLDWKDFIQYREAFESRAHTWADELSSIGDLAKHLSIFVQNTLK
ncbi:elongation factor P maturation arginine rhamnosyltransferase EarP [Candidatus Vallotia lariciata]|uniref:elongation factor P maturation arginine rhamnosyltransferase EarP n=1 Tax=Candidatus Vallotia laricis TaxID=2018052 RepID=UPI001D0065FC|nr:elongation factor P maturation arginine rhamnosyltransferase EarP [Candidatus Vallotia lariciata]UDG83174.1 elongation factor P maturation arginine rhamnosyltransferase EarP [Candidatus Vallotia lariciata]